MRFIIKDYETKRVIFQVSKEDAAAAMQENISFSNMDPDSYRKIKYQFSVDVLARPLAVTRKMS